MKHKLKAKYYIRYVDDFIILGSDKKILEKFKMEINNFLKQKLKIELHPEKSKIFRLNNRINFLGFRVFYYHKLLKKSNIRKMNVKFRILEEEYSKCFIDYGKIYDFLEGWMAYAKYANTYKQRKKIIWEIKRNFPNEISTKEINRISKVINTVASHTNINRRHGIHPTTKVGDILPKIL